jgi:TonB family protein
MSLIARGNAVPAGSSDFGFKTKVYIGPSESKLMLSKKCLFLVLLSTASLLRVFAQNDSQDSLKNSRFYYFNKSGVQTQNPDSAYFTRIITPDSAGSKLFRVEEVYRTGKTKMQCLSLTGDVYYKTEGVYTEYYPNGNLKAKATYDRGRLYGSQFVNFPNGKLYYSSSYDTAKKQLIINDVRDSTGTVQAENGKGKWVRYRGEFKYVMDQGPILNGLKEGEWSGRVNDTVTYACTYSKGVSVSGVSHTKSGRVINFTKDEIEPSFPGGINAFYKLLAANVRYPAKAKRNGIQGKVFLSFVIDKDGSLADVRVARGIGYGCDEEALKALSTSPRWVPGYQYGIPVRVYYSIPVAFTLQEM